jgi:hypothetical protein
VVVAVVATDLGRTEAAGVAVVTHQAAPLEALALLDSLVAQVHKLHHNTEAVAAVAVQQ